MQKKVETVEKPVEKKQESQELPVRPEKKKERQRLDLGSIRQGMQELFPNLTLSSSLKEAPEEKVQANAWGEVVVHAKPKSIEEHRLLKDICHACRFLAYAVRVEEAEEELGFSVNGEKLDFVCSSLQALIQSPQQKKELWKKLQQRCQS